MVRANTSRPGPLSASNFFEYSTDLVSSSNNDHLFKRNVNPIQITI